MKTLSVVVAVVSACATLVACTESTTLDTTSDWGGTIDTLESGRIVVRNPDRPSLAAEGSWTLVERFRVGALDGEGPDVFGDIRDIELGMGGELYVLDSQAAEVRVFGPEGQHLRTMGRQGEGPGELNRPAGLALDPLGTLWVMNWGNARYTGFDPGTGELRREVRRLASFASLPWPGIVDDERRLTDVGLDRGGEPAILRLDTTFVPTDTMVLPRAGEEHLVTFRRGDLRVMSSVDPFAPQPAWAPRPRGGVVLGEGADFRLHRVSFEGDTSMTIELSREPTPVTDQERDSALSAFERTAELADGATPDRSPRVASTKPAHGAIFVDDSDWIWVQVNTGAGVAWDVIGPDGRYLAQIRAPVPPSFIRPAVRGDRVALVTLTDEVPTVIVFELSTGYR